jgi:hypothetical protein
MLKLFLSILAIACLTLTIFTHSAQSQSDDYENLKPTIGAELPNMSYVTLNQTIPDRVCRGYTYKITIIYPTGTGSPDLDLKLANEATDRYNTLARRTLDHNCVADTTNTKSETETTFTATSPGKNYLSVVYGTSEYIAGYAHPSWNTTATVYDLRTASPITMNDIFENTDRAMPMLWREAVKGWCAFKDPNEPPKYYDTKTTKECTSRTPPMPQVIQARNIPLSALGNTYLTPEGMIIQVDFFSYGAQGPVQQIIQKNKLLRMGARKEIWE